jgi:ABC-type glycerol-3-phosphate transport system substrate-binding protein
LDAGSWITKGIAPVAETVRFLQTAEFARQLAAVTAFTEQTGIAVTVDVLPGEEHLRASRAAFGDPAQWDLLVAEDVIVAEQLHRGTLAPLGRRAHRDRFEFDDFLQAAIDIYRAADMVYAVPSMAMCHVLIYRRDMLQRFGFPVPATWDELHQTARAVQKALRATGADDQYGFVCAGSGAFSDSYRVLGSTLFPSWGWHWRQGTGQPPRIFEPGTVEALAFYANLLQETGPPNAESLTSVDARRLFNDGKAVFLLDTATALTTMRRDNPDSAGHQAAIALVPMGPTGRPEPGLLAPAFCIPATSRACEEAWELLKFLASPEQMLQGAIAGGYAEPARHSVLTADAYAAAYEPEFRLVIGETRRYARINRPMIPFAIELGEIVGAAAQAVIAGEKPAATALREAQERIDRRDWSIPFS